MVKRPSLYYCTASAVIAPVNYERGSHVILNTDGALEGNRPPSLCTIPEASLYVQFTICHCISAPLKILDTLSNYTSCLLAFSRSEFYKPETSLDIDRSELLVSPSKIKNTCNNIQQNIAHQSLSKAQEFEKI